MVVSKEADYGQEGAQADDSAGPGAERWKSVPRKTELVLRLLRGEPLDAVSRESQVPAHELESWKRVFLETGARGLKSRT
jgi:transposase